MKEPITGRCSCGSISFECASDPKFSLMCQCRQCQRITGAGHTAQFAMDSSATTITGQVTFYTLTSDDGNTINSAFCGTCGNPIYKTTSMMPELIMFHAATLDDPGIYQPQMVVYADSAQPWDKIDPAISRQD